MAYVPKIKEDEDFVLKQDEAELGIVQGLAPSGGGGEMSGGTMAAGSTGGAKPSRSGSFTNYQRYVDALAPQSQAMAKQITQQSLGEAGERFGGRVSGAQESFTGMVGDAPEQDQGLVSSAIADPVGFQGNTDQAQRLEALRTAKYTGPGTLQEAGLRGGLEQDIAGEVKRGELFNTEAGRESLLSGIKGYRGNAGMRRLDQYLLQATPEARQEFAGYGTEVQSRLDKQLGTAADISRGRAEEAVKQNEAVRAATQQQLTGATTKQQETSESDISQRTAALATLIQSGGDLTPEQISSAGITPEDWSTYRSGRDAAAAANTGTAFGRDVDPNSVVLDYLNNRMGGNFNANKYVQALQGSGRAPTNVQGALDLLRDQSGVRHGSLRGRVPQWAGGAPDTGDISVAGQGYSVDPYMQDGSVGATDEQRSRYQALQALSGVGEGDRGTLSDAGQMFDARRAGAAGSALDVQQREALRTEQASRMEALNKLIGYGSTPPPAMLPPATRYSHTGIV